MNATESRRAFERARSAELKARKALLAKTREDVIRLLNEALTEIKGILADFPTEYQQYRMPLLQKQIEQALATFSANSAQVLAQGMQQAWNGGQALAIAPLEAAGISIATSLPPLDTAFLMSINHFNTDRMRDVGREALSKINSQIGQAMIGAQSPGEAVGHITTILGEQSRERAITITRTSLGSAYAAANQQKMEQAAKMVPGYQKMWRRSGKVHSRMNHDAIDGQVQDVDKPFRLVSKLGLELLMMHPHDPTAPAGEVINCGCIAVPHMKSWKLSTPGRKPFTQEEIGKNPWKREVNDALQKAAASAKPVPVQMTEANPYHGADGRFTTAGDGVSVHATLTGNELGQHETTKDLRKAALLHAKHHFVGKSFTNVNSGHAIKVTWQGVKHSLSGKNNPEVRLSVALPEMLQKASYAGSVLPTDKHLKRGIIAMHRYTAKVSMGGEHFNVGIVTHERGNGHEHYDHAIITKGEPGAERLGRKK